MSFAGLADLLSGHVEHDGHCFQVNTHIAAVEQHVNAECIAKGIHIANGPCMHHGDAIHTWHHKGLTVTEFGHGASQEFPLATQLDISVHKDMYNGHCKSFTGPAARIEWLEKKFKKRGG